MSYHIASGNRPADLDIIYGQECSSTPDARDAASVPLYPYTVNVYIYTPEFLYINSALPIWLCKSSNNIEPSSVAKKKKHEYYHLLKEESYSHCLCLSLKQTKNKE